MKTYDRFHTEKLITKVALSVRVQYHWQTIEKENKQRSEKGDNETFRIKTYANGDIEWQLLARSRGLLYKRPNQWTRQQRQRADILFEEFPLIKNAYFLYIDFKGGYSMNHIQAEFHFKIWVQKSERSGIAKLKIASGSIKSRLGGYKIIW